MSPENSVVASGPLGIVVHMSQAAAQASAFYGEVAKTRRLWSIRDANGFPAPETPEGRAMPFWSSLARVERIVESVPAYVGFSPVELTWDDFSSTWLPSLERDGLRVGLNWTGDRAIGYDLAPSEVRTNIERAIESLSSE